MKEIQLTRGFITCVDNEDFGLVWLVLDGIIPAVMLFDDLVMGQNFSI